MFSARFFESTGTLSTLPGYEVRPQQKRMAECVYGALTESKVALIEAGTGIGKSLAYLYPAVAYARSTGNKVVVSTKTINLQEQLVNKDIPLLKELGLNYSATVIKGWSNYPCILKIEELMQWESTAVEQEVVALREDIEAGHVQSKSDVGPLFRSKWEQIKADPDMCLRNNCPYYRFCPVFLSKRQAEKADIIVVNHHLLLADVWLRQHVGWEEVAVLPPYHHVVIDEAHHLAEVATNYSLLTVSLLRVRRLLAKFVRQDGGSGLFSYLRQRIPDCSLSARLRGEIIQIAEGSAKGRMKNVDQSAAIMFAQLQQLRTKDKAIDGLRISRNDMEQPGIMNAYSAFVEELNGWRCNLAPLGIALEKAAEEAPVGEIALHWFSSLVQGIEDLQSDLNFLMDADDSSFVYWLQKGHLREVASICGAPIDAGPELRQRFFLQLESAVLTSATLTVSGDFQFFCRNIGLEANCDPEFTLVTEMLSSPFDYAEQVYAVVPEKAPLPMQPDFLEFFADAVGRILVCTQGRAFILFTSYRMMLDAARLLRSSLEEEYLVLVQGELSRQEMLDQFRKASSAVLFGTDSFWEGVDVVGEALSCVIMPKLPFAVPSEPMAEAKAEKMQSEGRNPFMEFFLPQAVFKFRQGFGRLIRSNSDRGVVVVFDRRIITKSYGRQFINSLPDCPLRICQLDKICQEVKAWL